MPLLTFFRENAPWLSGAFLLTFFSSFGQTFFIALSAGEIRAEFGLTHGEFGTLYMLATLASALTLPRLGQIVDHHSARTVTLIIVPALAAAAVMMSVAHHIAVLALALYLLRLFGQGMMSQNAFTAVARWFAARRGRATSITAIGVNAGEAVLPFAFVAIAGLIGWRNAWLASALLLVAVAMPLIAWLHRHERKPRSSDPPMPARRARDWTRAEVLRDPLFYPMLLCVMAPSFIGTSVFFHQVYLVELRGWSLEVFAASFMVMAGTVVTFALVAGYLIDRFTAVAILPSFLVPLALSCFVLGLVEAQWSAFAFMALMGLSYGFSTTLFGALWPEVYGVGNLGAIRALIVAFMVFGTAAGPGLTGYLIDMGIEFPTQVVVMGLYSCAACIVLLFVSRGLRARARRLARSDAIG